MILREIRGDFERLGVERLVETRDTGVAGVNIAIFYSKSIVVHFPGIFQSALFSSM